VAHGSSEVEHVWSGSSSDWIVVSDHITMQVLGHSGKIKLWRNEEDNTTSSIEVSLDKLIEFDSEGYQVQKSSSLASSDFEWSTPRIELINGYNVTVVELNAQLFVFKTMVPFFMIVHLYHHDATFIWNNQPYAIKKNHAKFTVKIQKWPFLSTDNTLSLSLELKVKGQSYRPSGWLPIVEGGRVDKRQRRLRLGDRGSFDVIETCLADGHNKTVQTDLYTQGSKDGMTLTFPYFKESLEYDPTLGFTIYSAANRITMSIVTAMLTIAASSILTIF